jgi:hypothetical protein
MAIPINSTGQIRYNGLTDADGAYLNTGATLTAFLCDRLLQTTLAGISPVTMTYQPDTNGYYIGTIPSNETGTLKQDQEVRVFYKITNNGTTTWKKEDFVANIKGVE